jgi:hypothetical protein
MATLQPASTTPVEVQRPSVGQEGATNCDRIKPTDGARRYLMADERVNPEIIPAGEEAILGLFNIATIPEEVVTSCWQIDNGNLACFC